MQFEPVDAPPADMRKAYLDGLPEHQEFFLEQLVARATTWWVPGCAYVVADGLRIVEFFVEPVYRQDAASIFDAAKKATRAEQALCKSFDLQMLGPSLASPARVTATAILFRSYSDRAFEFRPGLNFRMANAQDVPAVTACDDGDFFESQDEIISHVQNDGLHLLEQDGSIVGCGTQIRINPDRPAIDLGMLVARRERGRDLGSHIIAHMKDQVLRQGLEPVCGCAAHNLASHRALTKAGFHGDHRILKIEFSADF